MRDRGSLWRVCSLDQLQDLFLLCHLEEFGDSGEFLWKIISVQFSTKISSSVFLKH